MVVVANGCSNSPPPLEESRSAFVRVDIGIRSRTEREEGRGSLDSEEERTNTSSEGRYLFILTRRRMGQIDPN